MSANLSVLCKSSRYAKNPLRLLPCDLRRLLAQAQKACTRSRFCMTLSALRSRGAKKGEHSPDAIVIGFRLIQS
jgi:hypothetical protein